MRIPKLPVPEELPSSIEVRTFDGDLRTVYRPRRVGPGAQFKTFVAVLVLLFCLASCSITDDAVRAPFGMVELSPAARWVNARLPKCQGDVDCTVQGGLIIILIFALVKLGFWVVWHHSLTRYAAIVDDETL